MIITVYKKCICYITDTQLYILDLDLKLQIMLRIILQITRESKDYISSTIYEYNSQFYIYVFIFRFPLHSKSNYSSSALHYGVYLLNKNIAQLRWSLLGLVTKDLRATLPNLKSFLLSLSTRENRYLQLIIVASYSYKKSCLIVLTLTN